MRCLEGLKNSHFLSNVGEELAEARRVVHGNPHDGYTFSAIKAHKKAIYDDYVWFFDLKKDMQENLETVSIKEKDLIYCLKTQELTFIYSLSKSLINEAVMYSYNIEGTLPIYKGKHRVCGCTVYTVLINNLFRIPIASAN